MSQTIPADLATAETIPSTFSAWAFACFSYSIGVYSSWLGLTDTKWNGSVTVTAVILAPISFAKRTPCSTALAARSDPSVGTRMFLNITVFLLLVFPSDNLWARGCPRPRRDRLAVRSASRWQMFDIVGERNPA